MAKATLPKKGTPPVKTDDKKPAATLPQTPGIPDKATEIDFRQSAGIGRIVNKDSDVAARQSQQVLELMIQGLRDEIIAEIRETKAGPVASPVIDHADTAALHKKLDIIIEGLKRSGAIKPKPAPLFQVDKKKKV